LDLLELQWWLFRQCLRFLWWCVLEYLFLQLYRRLYGWLFWLLKHMQFVVQWL